MDSEKQPFEHSGSFDCSSALRCETCGGTEATNPKEIGYLICKKCYRFDGCSRHISPMVKPKPPCRVQLSDVVTTPHGIGKVVAREPIRDSFRWGVELVENPFWYSPVYYWSDELTII